MVLAAVLVHQPWANAFALLYFESVVWELPDFPREMPQPVIYIKKS
jgi:hypothetical protein